MKKLLLTLLLLPLFSTAQQIKGEVFDAYTKLPLSEATVINSDKTGTITNEEGEFSISCADKITISYVGYQSVTLKVEDCEQFFEIPMYPLKNNLGDVEIFGETLTDKVLLRQPVAKVRLDKDELSRGTGLFLDDAINANVPGVTMSRRAVSSGQQFNIRGYGNGVGFKGANNNFDTQGTKIYLNNIPLTDAEGVTVLDDIDFASIGNVEVIKGPSGTLYGSAIAGVVKLETITPKPGQVSLGQRVLIGDNGLRRYTTNFQMGTENAAVLVNYGKQESDGYMPHTKSQKEFVNLIGEFRPNSKQRISAYFGYSDSYDERGGELTIEQYNNFDYSGNQRYIKNNAHSEYIGFRAGLSHNYLFNEHIANITTVFASGAATNSSSAAGWSENNPVNYGFRSAFNFKYEITPGFDLLGTAGIEAQAQKSHPLSYSMVTDSSNIEGYNRIGNLKSNQVASTNNLFYFTQWTLAMPHGFSVTAGLGINNTNISLQDRLNSEEKANYDVGYHNLVSPHFAVNKVFNENLSLYASYSKAFRTPVSSNIVIGATGELNTGLVPEEGEQFEIGSKGFLMHGKLQYQLALFRTKFSNKMTSVAVALDSVTTAYTYLANSGGQIDKGIEVLVKYLAYHSETSFLENLRLWGNFAYSDFTYDDFGYQTIPRGETEVVTEIYDGKAVAGVSPVTANVGVDFATQNGFFGNVYYSYKDAMPITSNGIFTTDPYALLNAKLGYHKKFLEHFDLELFAGAKNLLENQYYTMVFINQLPDAYIPGPIGINFYGGIDLKYVF